MRPETGVFEPRAKHRGRFQFSRFEVYRTIERAKRVRKMLRTQKLRMQITVPNTHPRNTNRPDPDNAPPPWPVVIFAHGGGWTRGTAKDSRHLPRALPGQGIVCVNVNFRLTTPLHSIEWRRREKSDVHKRMVVAHRFPAAVRDLKAAIRRVLWEIEHGVLAKVADRSLRIGVAGSSSGASLMGTVAVTDRDRIGETAFDLEGLGEEGVTDKKVRKGMDDEVLDLGNYPSAPAFAALIATPHADLSKQLVAGRAGKLPRERTTGSFAYTETDESELGSLGVGPLSAAASPSSYLATQGAKGLPEFLFFHAQNDQISPFGGIDRDAPDHLRLRPRLRRRFAEQLEKAGLTDLGPGWKQLLEMAGGRSELYRLGYVRHTGWHPQRGKIAEEIGKLARGSLDDVEVPPAVLPRTRVGAT